MSNKFLMAVCSLLLLMASCKKEENRVYYEGGVAPVLTASSMSTNILSSATKTNTALTLSWTNPNYQFTTGVSSQDVTYKLQIDTTGANFSSPLKQEVAISKNLSTAMTVADLNGYMIKLGLSADIPHNIEMRLISNLNGAVPLISNVIKLAGIRMYEDFAITPPASGELYITGNATPSDWTNTPPAAQKAVRVDKGMYYIIMSFGGDASKAYKFVSSPGNWQPQYGGKSATGGDIGVNPGGGSDPDAIPAPSVAGSYKITLDFRLGRYTVVKQ